MKPSDFKIGTEFTCSGIQDRIWRCTDIGTRVIVAICISDYPDDPSWYNGPPYAVAEYTFDENDLPACEIRDNSEQCPDCLGEGRIEGCGTCESPCTTEGRVICFHGCPNCSGRD